MTTADIKADFMRRVRENKKSRWIRFAIVSIIFFLWVAWLGSWWVSIFWLLLFDVYITGYIPLSWWKKSKSKTTRSVMGWVDAIVYALILVYFVFAFVGQNYMIPSSSLEKTLLTGDYLWVNKATYGPRVPMTPVHFPLVHNKLPIINTDSYLDSPSLPYHRLKGLRKVERGDIVVFNFPAGDTVATKFEESSEYYDLLVEHYGWDRVNTDKATFGEVKYRPVDRRVNFVKRAVALPGDTFKIVDDVIYINGEPQKLPENAQFNYVFALSTPLTPDTAHDLGFADSDLQIVSNGEQRKMMEYALGVPENSWIYMGPLTNSMITALEDSNMLLAKNKFNDMWLLGQGSMFPKGVADEWTVSNWGGNGGIIIPRKGMKMKLNETSWKIYNRCIRNYENHPEAYIKDGVVYIDDKPADTYTFKMDYYFMMGDNRDNSQDSRFWGFVPEDHIVGTPVFILASFDQDRSIFNGGIRWNRMFKDANPDK